MSSMTLRMMCSCFCATALGSLGRSALGCSRSRKSPYSLRILVTRSVAALLAPLYQQLAWATRRGASKARATARIDGALVLTVGSCAALVTYGAGHTCKK